jgi:hypothetical protein
MERTKTMKEKMAVNGIGKRSTSNTIKRAFSIFLLVTAVFVGVGSAFSTQISHHIVKFKAAKAFALEANAPYSIPAGEYLIREMSSLPGPGHLFSLDRASDHKSMAILTTVRAEADRSRSARSKFIFNYESSTLPVLEKFYIAGGGWEVTGVEYQKDAGLVAMK